MVEAADTLPYFSTLRNTFSSGRPILSRTAFIILILAWCGIKSDISLQVMFAWQAARVAASAIILTADLKTSLPVILI